MTEYDKQILMKWYRTLDQEYGEHDPESGCPICFEAVELGIIKDPDPSFDSTANGTGDE